MEKTLEKIREIITKPMQDMEIIVESVTWEKESNQYYLKIEFLIFRTGFIIFQALEFFISS